MEKLESVLRAEDDARATVTDAHSQAATLKAETLAKVASLILDADTEARDRAETARDATVAQARTEAAAIVASAHIEQMTTVESATKRIDVAVSTVMKELVG